MGVTGCLLFYLAPNLTKLKLQNVIDIDTEGHIGMIFMMATCKNGYVHLVCERRRDEANVHESCLNNLRYVTLAAAKVKGRDSLVIHIPRVAEGHPQDSPRRIASQYR